MEEIKTCIVCGKAEPRVYNACAYCHQPMHQECGTHKQLGGQLISCPAHTQQVVRMQAEADRRHYEHMMQIGEE